jgi:hypothetical protein
VDITAEDFRSHFEMLSDATLLATNRDDLVEAAKAIYDQELAHRGLSINGEVPPPADIAVAAPAEGDASGPSGEGPEDLISVGSFTIVDEARMALGLLKSAGIPSGLANEKATMGALHLMVPASFEEAALQVLGGEISEEELAAQAEAAGLSESGESEKEEEEAEHGF